MIEYIKRVLGYALTGDISEQCWFLLYGSGANGKSTLINTVQWIMGDYAIQTPAETFLKRSSESIRNDLARLRGVRLVSSMEPSSHAKLNESLLKSFTGGDIITARLLFKEYFDYEPTGKLFMASNHLLTVEDNDDGFWRRVHCIPFEVRIPDSDQDKTLVKKLKKEAPGILRWMVEGCLEWQKRGLDPPSSVLKAVEDYRVEMDVLSDFLGHPRMAFDDGNQIPKTELYNHYLEFHNGGGVKPVNRDVFNRSMMAKGFQTKQVGKDRRRCWVGIDIRGDALRVCNQ